MTVACAENQSGKRKVVVVIRERGGETLPGVFKSEGQGAVMGQAAASPRAPSFMPTRLVVERPARALRNEAHRSPAGLQPRRRLHQQGRELFLPPASRRDWPPPSHRGPYLLRYAQEAAWREDNRRVPNGEQVQRVAKLALGRKKSVDFTGYWQRHVKGLSDQ